MTLKSMTGYGRASGAAGFLQFVWELKSVNGKALDIRLRLPGGWESLEADAKQIIAGFVSRGTVSANLSLSGSAPHSIKINEDVLAAYVQAANRLAESHQLAKPTAAELLALRGVADLASDMEDAAESTLRAPLLEGLQQAAKALAENRAQEGARLQAALSALLDRVEAARAAAAAEAAQQPGQLAARLTARLEEMAAASAVDPDRLAQEVALLALKADVTEELDRLAAHSAAARALLAKAEPVGRAFDFLAQEFNREVNTLCAKSSSVLLTRIGLDLKALVDQLREQSQNLE